VGGFGRTRSAIVNGRHEATTRLTRRWRWRWRWR
jgi:hypothetical protein